MMSSTKRRSFYYAVLFGFFIITACALAYAAHAQNRRFNAHAHLGAELHLRQVIHDICIIYYRDGVDNAHLHLSKNLNNQEYETDAELARAFAESCSYQIETLRIYTAGYPLVGFSVAFVDGQSYAVIIEYDNGYFSPPKNFRIWLIRNSQT